MKYRKKPVVIEAFRLNFEPPTDWFVVAMNAGVAQRRNEHGFDIHTLEGVMIAKSGDWIIQGIENEIYPCKNEIFEESYEQVSP